MSDDLSDLGSFEGTVRLFPLPNVVLFPRVLLPLHIFEPRYRQMTTDALAGDRLIGMALLRPGWEADYEGRPAVHATACLGRVLAEQRLEDGCFNLLLRGVARVRLLHELPQDNLYRKARVEVLTDFDVPSTAEAAQLRRELAGQVKRWSQVLGLGTEQLQNLLQSDLELGPLTDVLGFALPLDVAFKQSLLEELAVAARVRRLTEHLATTEVPKPAATLRQGFPPPQFSDN
jgi:Lon protease-like protein